MSILFPFLSIALISAPDAQLITVQPYDPNALEAIEKAISSSDVGINPNNDGNIIRINIPSLTEERRNELIKVVGKITEDNRVSIRNIRREANDQIKQHQNDSGVSEDEVKRWLHNIQELTDKFIADINTISVNKEKEISL